MRKGRTPLTRPVRAHLNATNTARGTFTDVNSNVCRERRVRSNKQEFDRTKSRDPPPPPPPPPARMPSSQTRQRDDESERYERGGSGCGSKSSPSTSDMPPVAVTTSLRAAQGFTRRPNRGCERGASGIVSLWNCSCRVRQSRHLRSLRPTGGCCGVAKARPSLTTELPHVLPAPAHSQFNYSQVMPMQAAAEVAVLPPVPFPPPGSTICSCHPPVGVRT